MSQNLSAALWPEFDHEMATTRRVLERVPEGRNDFRPHARSMTLARLVGHVAEIPLWALMTFGRDGFEVAPIDGPKMEALVMSDRARLLADFDEQVAAARVQLALYPRLNDVPVPSIYEPSADEGAM